MGIMLGNQSVEQIEKRMGVSFPENIREELLNNRQHSADTSLLDKEEWHCFDIPFTMVCGSMELAQKIFDSMKTLVPEIKEALHLSIKASK
jgi:hypothetical protein